MKLKVGVEMGNGQWRCVRKLDLKRGGESERARRQRTRHAIGKWGARAEIDPPTLTPHCDVDVGNFFVIRGLKNFDIIVDCTL